MTDLANAPNVDVIVDKHARNIDLDIHIGFDASPKCYPMNIVVVKPDWKKTIENEDDCSEDGFDIIFDGRAKNTSSVTLTFTLPEGWSFQSTPFSSVGNGNSIRNATSHGAASIPIGLPEGTMQAWIKVENNQNGKWDFNFSLLVIDPENNKLSIDPTLGGRRRG